MSVHESTLADLAGMLGNRLSRSKSDLMTHGASESYFPVTPPEAVAYPETTQEVAEIVRRCATVRCPVVAWGAGTSLEGHALAVRGGVCVDFSWMDKVLEINAADMDVRVQPGVTREALDRELRATGLFFPVDPGANATLGGMAATRASGTTAVRYGTMRDNVMGLEAVMADGRVVRTGSRARKSSAGYDLTALMVGSEGTLGLVTELTLKLHGRPEAVSAATCAYSSIGPAVDTVIATVQMGLQPARIEFVDGPTVAAFNAADAAGLPEQPHLFVEFHGSESQVTEEARRFGDLATEFGANGFNWSTREDVRTQLWRMRHNAAYAIKALRPGYLAVVTDLCVPISRLAEAVEDTAADIAESGLLGPILGHVGDGNLHAVLLVDPESKTERRSAQRLADRMAERALRLGGTVTGEHGVGSGKLGFMEAEHGVGWQVMAQIKRALDPNNILNPGKIVEGAL